MDLQAIFSPETTAWMLPAAVGLVTGILLAALVLGIRMSRLGTRLAVTERDLKAQEALEAERRAAIEQAEKQLSAAFSELARQSLQSNSEVFLSLARERLGQHEERARGDLESRQKAIESLVAPVRDALQKTEKQIADIEKERREAYGSIRQQLAAMGDTQVALQAETRNLVNALRRPEVRGQWGELTLRRLAELAGMVENCDFYEQENTETAEGRRRPDMIIRMPNGRELIVDVKTPLDAYLSAVEAAEEETRQAALKRHADNVRNRVRELALKSYWSQFEKSPEFVILFIPGDQFLAAALEKHPGLLEEALHQKVILATPTSLVALLKAVAYGWRQVAMEENAKKIQALGEDLHQRLAAFAGHLSRLGRQLGSSVDAYNSAVGSLERNVLPGARRFRDMGVSGRKDIEQLEPVNTGLRRVELSPEDNAAHEAGDAEAGPESER
jgi:DNA recombination protein RmuC